MADPFTDGEGEVSRAEHISPRKTGDNIQAKRVASYVWDGSNWQRMTQPGGSSGGAAKRIDEFGFQAKSEDATYIYWFFEDDSGGWYIRRKHKTTLVHDFWAGTGGYETVYSNSTSGPTGTPVWDTYGATF